MSHTAFSSVYESPWHVVTIEYPSEEYESHLAELKEIFAAVNPDEAEFPPTEYMIERVTKIVTLVERRKIIAFRLIVPLSVFKKDPEYNVKTAYVKDKSVMFSVCLSKRPEYKDVASYILRATTQPLLFHVSENKPRLIMHYHSLGCISLGNYTTFQGEEMHVMLHCSTSEFNTRHKNASKLVKEFDEHRDFRKDTGFDFLIVYYKYTMYNTTSITKYTFSEPCFMWKSLLQSLHGCSNKDYVKVFDNYKVLAKDLLRFLHGSLTDEEMESEPSFNNNFPWAQGLFSKAVVRQYHKDVSIDEQLNEYIPPANAGQNAAVYYYEKQSS